MMRKIMLGIILIATMALMTDCASSNKVKKRSQPKRGPIPCPVKDC